MMARLPTLYASYQWHLGPTVTDKLSAGDKTRRQSRKETGLVLWSRLEA
jgi:hypothetical protein